MDEFAIDLTGRVIVITRPEPEAFETARLVTAAGGTALLSPVLRVVPPPDPAPLARALAHPGRWDGILVTSVNGARALLAAWPPGSRLPVYAVGAKSASPLVAAGFEVTVADGPADACTLAATLLACNGSGRRYLFLRGEQGREVLIEALQSGGCQVDLVTAYATESAHLLSAEVQSAWRAGAIDAVTLFSSRSARSFHRLCVDAGLPLSSPPLLAVLSSTTAAVVRELGWEVAVVGREATAEALLADLAAYFRASPGS